MKHSLTPKTKHTGARRNQSIADSFLRWFPSVTVACFAPVSSRVSLSRIHPSVCILIRPACLRKVKLESGFPCPSCLPPKHCIPGSLSVFSLMLRLPYEQTPCHVSSSNAADAPWPNRSLSSANKNFDGTQTVALLIARVHDDTLNFFLCPLQGSRGEYFLKISPTILRDLWVYTVSSSTL